MPTDEEHGRMHDAVERYIYLILNSTAFSMGGYGAKGGEVSLALERLKTLYESGDEETRAYLWSMVRSEPEALYRSEPIWRLLKAETEPRVRTEPASR
jgi:hypothetical protein